MIPRPLRTQQQTTGQRRSLTVGQVPRKTQTISENQGSTENSPPGPNRWAQLRLIDKRLSRWTRVGVAPPFRQQLPCNPRQKKKPSLNQWPSLPHPSFS